MTFHVEIPSHVYGLSIICGCLSFIWYHRTFTNTNTITSFSGICFYGKQCCIYNLHTFRDIKLSVLMVLRVTLWTTHRAAITGWNIQVCMYLFYNKNGNIKFNAKTNYWNNLNRYAKSQNIRTLDNLKVLGTWNQRAYRNRMAKTA